MSYEKEFKDSKLGFYEIEFIPPKDLLHPRVPYKNTEGRLNSCMLESVMLVCGCRHVYGTNIKYLYVH